MSGAWRDWFWEEVPVVVLRVRRRMGGDFTNRATEKPPFIQIFSGICLRVLKTHTRKPAHRRKHTRTVIWIDKKERERECARERESERERERARERERERVRQHTLVSGGDKLCVTSCNQSREQL